MDVCLLTKICPLTAEGVLKMSLSYIKGSIYFLFNARR